MGVAGKQEENDTMGWSHGQRMGRESKESRLWERLLTCGHIGQEISSRQADCWAKGEGEEQAHSHEKERGMLGISLFQAMQPFNVVLGPKIYNNKAILFLFLVFHIFLKNNMKKWHKNVRILETPTPNFCLYLGPNSLLGNHSCTQQV